MEGGSGWRNEGEGSGWGGVEEEEETGGKEKMGDGGFDNCWRRRFTIIKMGTI